MTHAEELTCQELVELVTDYLEGSLDPVERARLDEHLDMCEGCRLHVDQLQRTIELTGRLGTADVSPEAEAALLAVFRKWRAGTL